MSDGDSIDVFNVEFCVTKGLINDGIDGLDMTASSDFWNNATVGRMNVNLGYDDVGQNMTAVFNDGGSGFVARTFDTQNTHMYLLLYHVFKILHGEQS